MKTTAVICEYNPFHNGHQYQLDQIRKKNNCDYIIALMSGYFTQRGAPALTNPMLRARMALLGGADLVIQLPALFSTASAPRFASGAISILNSLGCVDTLAYGIEQQTEASLFHDVVNLLNEEPPEYANLLKTGLSAGNNYPFAMEHAAFSILGKKHKQTKEMFHLLFSPNNILGIEYEKALRRSQSRITSMPILRIGSGYHDQNCDSPYASASAIRAAIEACPYKIDENSSISAEQLARRLNSISFCLPTYARALLESHLKTTPPIAADDVSSMLYLALMRLDSKQCVYPDCNIDFLNKIKKNVNNFCSFSQFAMLLKSKNITYANICRCLSYILLDITKKDWQQAQTSQESSGYARILGFKKSAAPLLRQIRRHSSIPLISKLADAKKALSDDALRVFDIDLRAAALYHGIEQIKSGQPVLNEFQRQLIILP